MKAGGHVHCDFETASELDLRKAGVYAYALHPSTRVLCLCWEYEDGSAFEWRIGQRITNDLSYLFTQIENGTVTFAHNAEFEWVIWNIVFRRQFKPQTIPQLRLGNLRCTMAMAAFWGLPQGLDDAADAAGLSVRKDKAGHAHMMRMNKPRTRNKDGSAASWWHEDEPERMDPLVDYCHQDVTVEATLARTIPLMPRREQEMWELNCRMNARGVGVDVDLVDSMARFTEREQARLNIQIANITGGVVTSVNQVGRLLQWLRDKGADTIASVNRATLETLVAQPGAYPAPVVTAASIRLEAAKSSTAKLDSINTVRGEGDRVRGLIAYYGAARTGRYAGRLCQPHNFPRGVLKGPEFDQAIRMFQHPTTTPPPRGVTLMDTVSSCLRGVFVPARGRGTHFAVGDFSQIEARVLAWLAHQTDILAVFASGQDVYTYAAKKIGSEDRQLGKVMTLALGFGMGVDKFRDTAATYGLTLDADTAQRLVWDWRGANASIRSYWYEYENFVRDIVGKPDMEVTVRGKVRLRSWDNAGSKHVAAILPGGRPLVYRNMRADRQDVNYGNRLTYLGVNQKTNRLEEIDTYGGKLVENITQAVARDVMAEALYTLEHDTPLRPVLTVHDEVICEFDESEISVSDAEALLLDTMTKRPAWAEGLPIAADVFTTTRYRK